MKSLKCHRVFIKCHSNLFNSCQGIPFKAIIAFEGVFRNHWSHFKDNCLATMDVCTKSLRVTFNGCCDILTISRAALLKCRTANWFPCPFTLLSLCVCHSGVAGFALQRRSQCQRLCSGVRHLLRGELRICQDDKAANCGAQVWSNSVAEHTNVSCYPSLFYSPWHDLVTCREISSNFTVPSQSCVITRLSQWQSLIVAISFNSAHSSLHPDGLVMILDSGNSE